MISFPKRVNALYPTLPPTKLKGIEDRARGAAKKLAEPLRPTGGRKPA
jgi:hypothetical protein